MKVIVKNDGTIGKVIKGEYGETKEKDLFYPAGYGQYYENELELLNEIEYKEGTKEDYMKYIIQDYIWGKIINVYSIGEYQILEVIDNEGEKTYHSYINYESTSHCYNNLETAITGAIAYKYDGENSQANKFFWKMIK